ncbi:MAG: universal stress protein [Bradymonadales bacterium]|jgi:nucleotide-binding universal stress UspA family protein
MSYFYQTQNIFVAGDFLPYSSQSLKIAQNFSQSTQAQVTLFHGVEKLSAVMRELLFPYAALGSDEVEILRELQAGVEERGREYIAKMGCKNTQLLVSFARDSLAKSILHAASEANADILFAGAYGTKPHTTGIIGSMASTMVAYSRIPFYLVKDPAASVKHQKILIALTEPCVSTKLMAWGVSFALRYGVSDIEIVSPLIDLKQCDRNDDFLGFKIADRYIEQAKERVTKRAKIAVQSLELPFAFEEDAKKFSFRHHTPMGCAACGILSCAEEIAADLIVIAGAQPSLTHNNAQREIVRTVTEYANQNVLIIPRLRNECSELV